MATYKLIASSTVGSGGASSIDFQNIPGTYTDLIFKISERVSTGGTSTSGIAIQFNGSAANFTVKLLVS